MYLRYLSQVYLISGQFTFFLGGGEGGGRGQKKAERKAANPNFSGNTEILDDLSFTAISVREPLIHIILIS